MNKFFRMAFAAVGMAGFLSACEDPEKARAEAAQKAHQTELAKLTSGVYVRDLTDRSEEKSKYTKFEDLTRFTESGFPSIRRAAIFAKRVAQSGSLQTDICQGNLAVLTYEDSRKGVNFMYYPLERAIVEADYRCITTDGRDVKINTRREFSTGTSVEHGGGRALAGFVAEVSTGNYFTIPLATPRHPESNASFSVSYLSKLGGEELRTQGGLLSHKAYGSQAVQGQLGTGRGELPEFNAARAITMRMAADAFEAFPGIKSEIHPTKNGEFTLLRGSNVRPSDQQINTYVQGLRADKILSLARQ